MEALAQELPAGKINEEPMFPESRQSGPISADFADLQLKDVSTGLGRQAKISSSPKRP